MSEKRLIDANALPAVRAYVDDDGMYRDIVYKEDIDAAPTIDAVEVVRCRDCCLGKPFKGRLMCHWTADEKGWGACATTPDHYCARGKRKEPADEK